MTSRATASRSPVVPPGRAASRTASRGSATTRPASRIVRIWSGVLYSMRSRPSMLGDLRRDGGHGVEDARRDLLDRPGPVDAGQQPALGVGLGERRRLLVVDVQATSDHLVGVVLAP